MVLGFVYHKLEIYFLLLFWFNCFRQHGLLDSMPISILLTRTIFEKPCIVLLLGCEILNSLFALTQFLHCDLSLKLAEVNSL